MVVFTGYGNEEQQNLEDLLSEISEPDEASSTKVTRNNPIKCDDKTIHVHFFYVTRQTDRRMQVHLKTNLNRTCRM